MEKPWYPSCKATHFVAEIWPFKRGGLSSGVRINTFMFRFTLSSSLFRRVGSQEGGLSKGVPLYQSPHRARKSRVYLA